MEAVRDEVVAMRKELESMSEAQSVLRADFREVVAALGRVAEGRRVAPDGLGALAVMQEVELAPESVPRVVKPAESRTGPAPSFGPKTEQSSARPPRDPDRGDGPPSPKRLGTQLAGAGETEEQMQDRLMAMFRFVEEAEAERSQMGGRGRRWIKFIQSTLKTATKEDLTMILDAFMGYVIIANAIFIGLSLDMSDDSTGWVAADIIFSMLFATELAFKVYLRGLGECFAGSRQRGAWLDASLVIVDLVQLIMILAGVDGSGDVISASLFRLVRLLKLGRVLNALRTELFTDLLAMVAGLLGALSTLGWSMVLFGLFIYMASLVYREILGRTATEKVSGLFDSVPRSILTTFRCSFGDCSTDAGTPILEHILQERGAIPCFIWCCFSFMVMIGLFNVISAIFVQAIMESATAMEDTRRLERLTDKALWSRSISTLIRQLLQASHIEDPPEKLSEGIDLICGLEVHPSVIDTLVQDPIAIEALEDLEIDQGDHASLGDILDPNKNGSIGIDEFVEGLARLRGMPRRSDIVTVDLMVRSLQRSMGDLTKTVGELIASDDRWY